MNYNEAYVEAQMPALPHNPYMDSRASLGSDCSMDDRTALLVGMWPLACSMFEIDLTIQRAMV